MPSPITLNVNGQRREVHAAPDTPLFYILRNDLGLKSPKFGCGLEQCGACKVLVNGEARPSCRLPISQLQGAEITTVEGLTPDGSLSSVQEAFVAEQAAQCGFCTTGMIIAAHGLLQQHPLPSDEQIGDALSDHLCRCGVYDRVRRAVRRASGQRVPEAPYETERVEPEGNSQTIPLPHSLQRSPELDSWLRINEDGTITLFSGKVELGQGLKTAIAQIGAEELDVNVERIRVVTADTERTPDEGLTVGSMSLETSGNAIRLAAAEARRHLLSIAFEELEVPLERLVVQDGVIHDPLTGRNTDYWKLFAGQRFAMQITGDTAPKSGARLNIVGQPLPRLDLPAIIKGEPVFVHDLELPQMVHARVLRPPHPNARLQRVDTATVASLPGVLKVVQDGSFLGVIAEREEQAIRALFALRQNATWQGEAGLPPGDALYEALYNQPQQESFLLVEGTPGDVPVPPIDPPSSAAQTFSATYSRPYQMHASLGPSAAAALYDDQQADSHRLTLWVHSQGVFPPRATIARVLGMAEEEIHVIHREGAGCYGHNGADDAALDAALLARALPGRPVLLKWMRQDEHGWEPYAPAMKVEMQASLDEEGRIVDWNQDIYSPSHFGRPRSGPPGISGLLAAWHLQESFQAPPTAPAMGTHSGSHRNGDPLYAFARRRIVKHWLRHTPLRVSSMRGLGAYANVFAIESFMDELAHAAGIDPVTFRLQHLDDPRARAVIEAAARKAGWYEQAPSSSGWGRGIAFARYKNRQSYVAIVVELQVDRRSGEIRLERAVIAADSGRIINPDGLSNQLEGGFVQSASLTLKEQVTWDEGGITSRDWDSYPILRFPKAPLIETVLLDRPAEPHMGAGEAAHGPTPAAIANAIFDASGLRLRHIPFTPQKVRQSATAANG
jgi:CO/xanthine dehydrogenase Mo-binding subunit/aerobic-type carbon monoxide dehydrogenase small subunit (CoxS/CutS family)